MDGDACGVSAALGGEDTAEDWPEEALDLLIRIPWFFIPVEQGSTLAALAAFVVLCLGAYYRP